jgi:16S rRNA (cytosine967-C5)-methyltransferase
VHVPDDLVGQTHTDRPGAPRHGTGVHVADDLVGQPHTGLAAWCPVSGRPDARVVALRVLERVDSEGAYANLALRHELDRSGLDERDRAFVAELVYGTTRLRRRLDHLIGRFLLRDPEPGVRAALRLGAYQLHELGTPPHAAVDATVEAVRPKKAKGFVNAILRRVADAPVAADAWPSDAVRLSFPDWVLERLVADLGHDEALAALAAMNEPAARVTRADGYAQDLASQWTADLVGAEAGERVADLCAAPGGKATALGATGAQVVAVELRESRAGLVKENSTTLGAPVSVVVGDATVPPLRAGHFDRVLLDAPCSGLGTLRRRADARWRIEADAVDRLAALQRELLAQAALLVRPGGTLVYSVCTLTAAEGPEVAATLHWPRLDVPAEPWQAWESGVLLLPQAAGTDGMFLARWTRPADS